MDFGTSEADGNTRTSERTSIFRIRDALHYFDKMAINTLHLHTLIDWRRFLVYLPRSKFIFSSKALVEFKLKTRPGQGVDLRLVGSKDLVLYNAHRCYL